MWTDLAFRHPYELLVLNAILNVLPIYLAFTIAARVHNGRGSRQASSPATALGFLAAGLLWGSTSLIDRHFGLAIVREPVSVWNLLHADPVMVLMPIITAVVICTLPGARARALAVLGSILVYVIVAETPIGSPAFGYLSTAEQAIHWAIIAFGALVTAIGASVMTTRSHSSRLSAVLATCCGTKIVGIAIVSATWSNLDILSPMRGTLTPGLLAALTLFIAGSALVAIAEARRLLGSEYRQELLNESERRMRMLAEAAQEGLIIHRDGVVLDANGRTRALCGFKDPVGMRLADLIPDAASWRASERFDADPAEVALVRADGTSVSVEATCRPLDDGRAVTALRDVSERDQARAAAAQERNRLRLALDAADEGFVLYDENERLVLANQAYLNIQPSLAAVIRPGMTHSQIVERFVRTGLWPADVDRETYLAERIAMFRAGAEDHVSRLADGRWLLARDRKLPTGETVSVRIDVTRVKERERELEASEERVRFLARNDALTGIANRRTFDVDLAERMERLHAAGAPTGRTPALALLMIDLDRFKPVNDQHGHAAGDELLRVLAKRFEGELRGRPRRLRCASANAADLIARIGGDEFAALACVENAADAMGLATRLRAAAEEPVMLQINGMEVRVSVGASVGVALGPVDADDGEALLHAADLALYAAKDAGRGRAVAFEPAMAEAAEKRRLLEEDLRHALARDEIELHYQVQTCVRSNQIVGYEALMRWRHPERGLIPPVEFIPLAEETGLIVPLGRWALERAARDFATMPGTARVAVNVSPVQFGSGDLAEDVSRALRSSGLSPERLEVEITEQVLIDDTDATLDTLHAVRALGVGLSLDDFGSGYSSLGYLTRFPFTKIKIDRMFITSMATDDRARALVRSILALASSLGLKVTAEGVETQGQLLMLAADGCDEAQGWLLGRPAPLGQIARATLVA